MGTHDPGGADGAGQGRPPGPPPDEQRPLVDYPAPYTFKVMGLQSEGFIDHVRVLFARVLGVPVERDSISEQPSSKGKYVSLNVTVYLHTETQRRALYEALHRDPRIVYYL